MEISSSHQMYVFVLSVLSGILCGLFFDFQRNLRKRRFAGRIRTTIEDIVFVLFCIVATIFVGYVFDEGAVRSYLIMGMTSGALFYAAFLHPIAVKVLDFMIGAVDMVVLRPIKTALKFMLVPLKKAMVVKNALLSWKKSVFRRVSKKIKTRCNRLKKRIKML